MSKEAKLLDVSITCGGEVVKLQLCPDDFVFSEFDCWLKSRFAIASTDRVCFKDDRGKGNKHFYCTCSYCIYLLMGRIIPV